ncbi:hypothetical protein HMPREF9333_01098 [Johnsonella ignava ATCC 51276]|uniref:Uncharacterized protein n=1 Tax=Johnsonella ignava ATCC 51276 TaxID=679200 RepID=G5GHQ8_9FIRM|nr:hypothetical protein [Johnsonella ignava]EHI55751.1 hypothetical protein HMPREF9333_01098 [Johnsonella ignava ATCC 51276]
MARRRLGGLVLLAAVAGAVAAGVSYILQYNSYHKELESEFHEFEDEDIKKENEDCLFSTKKTPSRNYVALSSDRDDFVIAAKDTAKAAKGMAGAAKEMLKDVGNIILENASSASSFANDAAKSVSNRVKADSRFEKKYSATESVKSAESVKVKNEEAEKNTDESEYESSIYTKVETEPYKHGGDILHIYEDNPQQDDFVYKSAMSEDNNTVPIDKDTVSEDNNTVSIDKGTVSEDNNTVSEDNKFTYKADIYRADKYTESNQSGIKDVVLSENTLEDGKTDTKQTSTTSQSTGTSYTNLYKVSYTNSGTSDSRNIKSKSGGWEFRVRNSFTRGDDDNNAAVSGFRTVPYNNSAQNSMSGSAIRSSDRNIFLDKDLNSAAKETQASGTQIEEEDF